MKKCNSCGTEKELIEFQIRMASKDGLTARCKKCLCDYDKSRAKHPHRVQARSDYQKTTAGMQASSRAKIKYINKNPKKRQCHIAVGNALRDGYLLKMPCSICGSKRSHAHHPDYNKPLDVIWLCASHHKEWHAKNGEGLNPF